MYAFLIWRLKFQLKLIIAKVVLTTNVESAWISFSMEPHIYVGLFSFTSDNDKTNAFVY